MRTRRILSVLAFAVIATTALLLFPRSANAGTSYYYTTDPCAGPIVINGVIYHPSCSIPAGNTTVTQQYYVPGASTTTPIQTIQRRVVRVRGGTVKSACPSCVLRGTGRTLRLLAATGADMASRPAASPPRVGSS